MYSTYSVSGSLSNLWSYCSRSKHTLYCYLRTKQAVKDLIQNHFFLPGYSFAIDCYVKKYENGLNAFPLLKCNSLRSLSTKNSIIICLSRWKFYVLFVSNKQNTSYKRVVNMNCYNFKQLILATLLEKTFVCI